MMWHRLANASFWSHLRWYHGVLFLLVMNLLSGGWLSTRSYLDSVGRPPFMPPDGAFAPIWIGMQILMVIAGFQLVRSKSLSPLLLGSYASLWAFFSMFSWFYFGLHSPILGFLTTVGMFVANALNLYFGFKASQTKYALLLTPLMVWLVLACCIAGWQFLYTPDEFFQMAPLCHRAP